MPKFTSTEIEKLCDQWCSASSGTKGKIIVGEETEKFRLTANNVSFHELDHQALCASIIGLTKVLLRPGLNAIVHQDHFAVWSWCGELLLGQRANTFSMEEQEIKSLYATSIHAALAHCHKTPATSEEKEEQCRIRELQPHHAKQLCHQSSLVLAYLGFPLLEAVLKRSCAEYVALDGQVISRFSVPRNGDETKTYAPSGSKYSRKCSSLRDLLFLHKNIVANSQLQTLLEKFRSHLYSLDRTQDPFDLIYFWRNQSLHGSTNFQTIGGVLLNLSILISLFEIEHTFEEHRQTTLTHYRWSSSSAHRIPSSFYPPY